MNTKTNKAISIAPTERRHLASLAFPTGDFSLCDPQGEGDGTACDVEDWDRLCIDQGRRPWQLARKLC